VLLVVLVVLLLLVGRLLVGRLLVGRLLVGRLAVGWRSAGGRLAVGWRSAGGRLAVGWRSAGGRLAVGWRSAGGRLGWSAAGRSAGELLHRLASLFGAFRQAADARHPTTRFGWRLARAPGCVFIHTQMLFFFFFLPAVVRKFRTA